MSSFETTTWPSERLPTDICALILIYEGSIVEDYIRCIVRRMCVRSYKRALTRRFRFSMLPIMHMKHLCFLVQTQLQTFERCDGVIARNISRVHILPWVSLINKYNMKAQLHNTALNCIKRPMSPNLQTRFRDAWLDWQRDVILTFSKV